MKADDVFRVLAMSEFVAVLGVCKLFFESFEFPLFLLIGLSSQVFESYLILMLVVRLFLSLGVFFWFDVDRFLFSAVDLGSVPPVIRLPPFPLPHLAAVDIYAMDSICVLVRGRPFCLS